MATFDAPDAKGYVDDIAYALPRLRDEVAAAEYDIDDLESEVATLKARIAELEGKLEVDDGQA
ncbi:hypothetical protein KAW64_12935 [bacterium]|nr:hypothetical protein [bacterium]